MIAVMQGCYGYKRVEARKVVNFEIPCYDVQYVNEFGQNGATGPNIGVLDVRSMKPAPRLIPQPTASNPNPANFIAPYVLMFIEPIVSTALDGGRVIPDINLQWQLLMDYTFVNPVQTVTTTQNPL